MDPFGRRSATTLHAGPRDGTTLLELLLTLVVLSIALAIAAAPARRALDAWAVRAARDALAAGVDRARAAAVARGGAVLVADVDSARYRIETAAGEPVGPPVDLRAAYGVRLRSTGAGAEPVRLRFDVLGIGRMTSRTLRTERGAAEARLTLSTYGRVRRW